jgi:hypothetical protein
LVGVGFGGDLSFTPSSSRNRNTINNRECAYTGMSQAVRSREKPLVALGDNGM